MNLGLDGREVLITGGSKGVGLACARGFLQEDCRVILVARDEETLRAAVAGLGGSAAKVEVHIADLSSEEERTTLFERFPDVDVLVNNAGAIPGGELPTWTMASWRSAWDLKVMGYVHLAQLFLDQMRGRKSGAIVNVIGSAGRAPRSDYVCGAAGNAALIAFTEAVGGRSPDFGVRVVGVNPGPTATQRLLGRPVTDDGPDDATLVTMFPDLRVVRPSEVADVVVFLASSRASAVSGVVLDVDRGLLRRPSAATPAPPVGGPADVGGRA